MKPVVHVPRIRWRRPPNARVRLSALVVGAQGGEATACAESLAREWERAGRRAEDLEIVAAADEPGGIDVALARTSGEARDIVAFVRADVVFLEGSLRPLLERLQGDPDCGAVAPRAFADPAGQLQHAPRRFPSAFARLARAAAGRWAIVGRIYAARRFACSLGWWTSEQPLRSDALPSACVFQRRKAIERAAGLLDPRFDADWGALDFGARIARSGYRLLYEPRSRIVVRSRSPELLAATRARREFCARHFGPLERAIESAAAALEVRGIPRREARAQDLGLVEHSPVFEFGRPLRFVVEVSSSPRWLDAAGAVGEGHVFRFEDEAWAWIGPGPHFVRAIDRDSGRTIGAWRFHRRRTPRARRVGASTSVREAA